MGASALVSLSDVQPPSVYKSHILNGPINKLYLQATVLTGSIGNKKIKIRSPGYKFASNAVLDIIDYSSPNKELGIPYIVSVVYKKRN